MMGSTMMGDPGWGYLLRPTATLLLVLAAVLTAVWLLRSVCRPRAQIDPVSAIATARAGTFGGREDALLITDPAAQHELRASNVDREYVAQALSMHLASGRLTMSEFEERVTSAYSAQTLGQLRARLEDLPVGAG